MKTVLHTQKNNEFFRQLLFIATLILVGVVIFFQLNFFVGAVLGAFTLYIVFRQWLFKLTEKWHWRGWVAALALTVLCGVILAGLGYLMFTVIAAQIPSVDASQIVEQANDLVEGVNDKVGYKIVTKDAISKSGGILGKVFNSVLNMTYSTAANVFMMLVLVYFLFARGRKMECYAYRYAPFRGESLAMLREEVKQMIYSNAVCMPLILICQTITSAFGYWIVGLDNYLFWGFLTAICGLVPLVGTAIVYIPLSIYYAVDGSLWTGVIILLYGIVVISNTDNVFRIFLMRKVNNTHPLIVIFGVILGIPLFGFWGIIFGPLLISGFLLLVRIYYYEYGLLRSPEEAEDLAMAKEMRKNPPPLEPRQRVTSKMLRKIKTARPDKEE